jgi:hypothetical protein
MTELDLYKFIINNDIEWHRDDNEGTIDVVIFVPTYQIEDFNKLEMVKGYVDDGGIECRMMEGYFCFWMKDICDHYGIDINKIFYETGQTLGPNPLDTQMNTK